LPIVIALLHIIQQLTSIFSAKESLTLRLVI
jgi:hypothetical protein